MAFTNLLGDYPFYCSSSSGDVKNGIMYSAAVYNPAGGTATQFCEVVRVDTALGPTAPRQILRTFYAKDSKAFAIQQGADPDLDNGKYGNVTISVDGEDIYLVLEVRMNSVNKPKWIKLAGYAV